MECINDILCGKYALVGIKDFINCPAPENVLFINDIPGFTMRSAAAIANDEQRTGFELMNDKIRLATKKVFHKFSSVMAGSFDFNAVIEAREISSFSTKTIAPAALERGLVLRRWQSEMARIYIEELYIRTVESGIVNIKIYDGDVVKVYQVSVLANVTNAVTIRYKCKSEQVKILFDQTDFTTYGCQISDSEGCHTCSSSYSRYKLQIKGWDGDKETNGCFGLGVLANVQCFEETIICQLLPRMDFMIWYQSGIEILMEKMQTGRVNAVVTFGDAKTEKLLAYLETELLREEEAFRKISAKFLKNTRGECFTCKGTRVTYGLPG